MVTWLLKVTVTQRGWSGVGQCELDGGVVGHGQAVAGPLLEADRQERPVSQWRLGDEPAQHEGEHGERDAPTRNMKVSEWPNASTNPWWIGAGSAANCLGLVAIVFPETLCMARSTPAGRYLGSSVNRRLLKMAPKTATPNDPPIDRKNVALEVAVPRCSCGGDVHDDHDEHLHDEADAESDDEHVEAPETRSGVFTCIVASRKQARPRSEPHPMIGKIL